MKINFDAIDNKVLNVYIIKEEYLVKSNQVFSRMEIESSDCQPTIAKMFYIVIRT
jgi:hypothetical protein